MTYLREVTSETNYVDRDLPLAYTQLAHVYEKEKNISEAKENYIKALEL